MQSLRVFLSRPRQHGLASSGLLDREVIDPLLEERLQLIRRQVFAALALHSLLSEMGCAVPDTIDLMPLISMAKGLGALSHKAAGILRVLNADANNAKHRLMFRSQL